MKTLFLNNGVGRYGESAPFLLDENKISLQIIHPNLFGEFVLIVENNGSSQQIGIPNNGIVTVENLTAGELKGIIKHCLKGTIIKEYELEPLVLCESGGRLTCTPEFTWLKSRIKDLEVMLITTRAALIATIKVAWEDYSKSPYMDGKGWEAFITKYGYTDLSDEEIKIIKGEDNND